MPAGMFLRSSWEASSISDPTGELSLDAYEAAHAVRLQRPIPLADYLRYARWYQRQRGARRRRAPGDARSSAADGGFERRSSPTATPSPRAGSSSRRGRRVRPAPGGVRGPRRAAGAPLVELRELGRVRGPAHRGGRRGPERHRAGRPAARGGGRRRGHRTRRPDPLAAPQRLAARPRRCRPPDALPADRRGSGRAQLARRRAGRVPPRARAARRADRLPVHPARPPRLAGAAHGRRRAFTLGRSVASAEPSRRAACGSSSTTARRREVDRVVLGHRLRRPGGPPPAARAGAARRACGPATARRCSAPGFESSVPGLHFVGAFAAASFGPVMRFVSGHAVHRPCARRATSRPARRPATRAGARPRPRRRPEAACAPAPSSRERATGRSRSCAASAGAACPCGSCAATSTRSRQPRATRAAARVACRRRRRRRVAYLLDLAERERLHGWVLIPTHDEEAALIARHHDELAARLPR